MHRFFVAALAVVLCGQLSAQIVLSEIMFNPAGNERYDEFIELYNLGDEPVDLFGWLLSDGTKFNTILPFENTSVLQPHHYALILVPNYFENSLVYEQNIPQQTVVFTIDRSQFGAYGLKNTEGEPISIHRPDTTLIAKYKYSPDNDDGFSEEKVELGQGDSARNWQNSIRHGGTPGYENSVTPKPFDLALTHFDYKPQRPSIKDSISFILTVQNVGRQSVSECVVVLHDSTKDELVLLEKNFRFNTLASTDSIELTWRIMPLPAGDHVFLAAVELADDGFPENNNARAVCRVVETYPPHSVVLNEIMYDTDEKSDEWIELYNASERPVNLENWMLRDKRKTVVITPEKYILQAGAYCLLTNIEFERVDCNQLIFSLPELNNSGDEIVLMDAAGVVIDSLMYDKSFGGARHVSLERVRYEEAAGRSSNWGSCSAETGSTPGRPNSISPKDVDAAMRAPVSIEPVHPMAGETASVSCDVENAGRTDIQNINLQMSYRAIGESDFTVVDHAIVDDLGIRELTSVTFTWPAIPPGIHVIKIQLTMPHDMISINNEICDTIAVSYPPESIVINEIMYSPARDECEWIELFNKSDYAVELMNWSVSDSDTSEKIVLSNTPLQMNANEFLVLCADSFLLSPSHFWIKKFPVLNNSRDTVLVFDACRRVVDNVVYKSDWGGATGRSLERINPDVSAHEKTNWTTCVDPDGHTAGVPNSVFVDVVPQQTLLAVSPDPFSPDGDGRDDFVALSYALTGTVAHVNLRIFDVKGRLVRFLLNNAASGAERTVYWDGLNDDGIKCRMGIYIILLEALNESKMGMEQARKTVVLAGAL